MPSSASTRRYISERAGRHASSVTRVLLALSRRGRRAWRATGTPHGTLGSGVVTVSERGRLRYCRAVSTASRPRSRVTSTTRRIAVDSRPSIPAGRRVAAVALAAVVIVGVLELLFDTIVATREARFADLPFYLVFVALPANLVPGRVAVLTTRRPENSIGWLLLVSGALVRALPSRLARSSVSVIAAGGWDWPLLVAGAAWVASSWFIPAIGILVVFLPLLFPTGHLLSPRWRWGPVAIAGIFGVAAGTIGPAMAARPDADPHSGPLNPLVPPEPLSTWIQTTANLSTLIAPPVFVLGAREPRHPVSSVARRRAAADQVVPVRRGGGGDLAVRGLGGPRTAEPSPSWRGRSAS